MVASGRGSSNQAYRNILIDQIADCLAECAHEENSARDSAIFWLYYRHGLTAKAISRMSAIGLAVKGVESTLLRLTRMVRGKLDAGPTSRGVASGQ